MPTVYPGNRTATQAPSAPPEPEGVITASLPADGDPPNASTFAQAFKVLADFIAWLLKPSAKASAWTQAIMKWRAAGMWTRFLIDHLGFPGGQIWSRDFYWNYTPDVGGGAGKSSKSGTTASTGVHMEANPEWTYRGVQTTNTSIATGGVVMAGGGGYPCMSVGAGGTNNDYAMVASGHLGIGTDAHRHIVCETQARVDSGTFNHMSALVGMFQYVWNLPMSIPDFIGFRKANGVANWQCVTRAAGVETATDSGVPVASTLTPDRIRWEWHGATVADDTNARVRFYINGALVATHAANIPAIAGDTALVIGIQNVTGTYNNSHFQVAPIKLRANIVAGDVGL